MDEVIVLCIGKNLYTCIYMDLGSFDQKLAKDRDLHDASLDDEDSHNKYSVPPWYDQVKDISKNHRVSVGIYQHRRSKPATLYELAVFL